MRINYIDAFCLLFTWSALNWLKIPEDQDVNTLTAQTHFILMRRANICQTRCRNRRNSRLPSVCRYTQQQQNRQENGIHSLHVTIMHDMMIDYSVLPHCAQNCVLSFSRISILLLLFAVHFSSLLHDCHRLDWLLSFAGHGRVLL